MSGLRNELGKLFTPYMREIGSGIDQSVRNRNLITEQLPGVRQLPIKYDMLNGNPVKDWDFLTRAYNAISPIQLNLDQSVGRNFLFDSGYDLRMSTYYAPDGTNLTDSPRVRSEYQRFIGMQNLERDLDKLAVDPKIIASMEKMYADIKAGLRDQYDARDYYHNIIIDNLFQKARRRAWAQMQTNPEAVELMEEARQKRVRKLAKKQDTRNILNIYK